MVGSGRGDPAFLVAGEESKPTRRNFVFFSKK